MRTLPKNCLLLSLLLAATMVTQTRYAWAQFETRGTFLTNHGPSSIAIGDFNRDGRLDLAVAAADVNDNNIVILLGNGDGTFRQGGSYTVGLGATSLAAADFNHDGNLDLAVANEESGYVSILLGNGDGTFQAGPQSPAVPAPAAFITVGDFNGDGNLDLVTVSYDNPCKCISVLLGNGDGTFQNAVNTEPPFEVESIGLGDFNGDGNLDVVTAGDFTINVLLGNGNGTFDYGASYPSLESPASIAVADFSGNQKLDLAVASASAVSVLMGNGDGTFQPAVNYATNYALSVTAAVLTNSHNLDLVVANSVFPAGVTVFSGNGSGTFQPGVFYPSSYFVTEYAAVGDFTGDHQTDIVYADYENEGVTVLLNTGVASYSPTTPLKFEKQAVGTTSQPQAVTLTNTGTTELKIQSMKASAEFAVTSTCGSSVAAGANCTISATFSPTRKGAVQGSITIVDSASTKPQVIEVLGTGT
jgi:large repetitive protein